MSDTTNKGIDDIPVMLKLTEASAKFNLSYHFCRQLVLNNKVVFVRAGTRYLINEQSLKDYLNGKI